MFLKSIISLGTGCVLTVLCTIPLISQAQTNDEVRFICASGFDQNSNQRFHTTYAWTQRGKSPVVRWKYKWFNSSEYTPERRCQEVSSRFQTAYDNQSINYITNGTQNNQEVICTARQERGTCADLLLTLRPGDDSLEILTAFKDQLKGRGGTIVEHSSGKKQVYYKINFKKFLQTAPVEEEK